MRMVLYIRVESTTHSLLSHYAASRQVPVNDVVNEAIAQILYQVCAAYAAPGWLREAVAKGDLPISRCLESDDEDQGEDLEVSNVINWRGCG
jgi:hypothetical protein